VRLVS